MNTTDYSDAEHQPVTRRGFAKVAIAALAVAGFGTATLNSVSARHGADDRRRRRRREDRRHHHRRHHA